MNLRFTILGRSFGYSFALSSFEGASDTRTRGRSSLLFTENCTEETRKSKTRETEWTHVHDVFLTEVFYRKVESNRIDFPKQIRIKRKYLKS